MVGSWIVEDTAKMVMHRQPMDISPNYCWIPPVVCISRFFLERTDITVESVLQAAAPILASEGGDGEADAVLVISELFAIQPRVEFLVVDNQEGMVLRDPIAGESINVVFIDALIEVFRAQGLALFLVERTEQSERRNGIPPTHYLVACGIEVKKGRRGAKVLKLSLKDPMEGDAMQVGFLESECLDMKLPVVRLRVPLIGGGVDRYKLLETALYGAAAE
jgi:hypothetical protein